MKDLENVKAKPKFFTMDDGKKKHKKKPSSSSATPGEAVQKKIYKNRNTLDLNDFHQMKKKKKIRTKSVKQKLRDIERTLEHAKVTGTAEESIIEASKPKIQALKSQKKDQRKDKFTDQKYEKIKFIEKKKLSKLLKKAQDQKAPEEVMKKIQGKLNYIKFYPKGSNYISILKEDQEMGVSSKLKRQEILKETSDKRTLLLRQKLDMPFEQVKLNKGKKAKEAKEAQQATAKVPKVKKEKIPEKAEKKESEGEEESPVESDATEEVAQEDSEIGRDDGLDDDDFFM